MFIFPYLIYIYYTLYFLIGHLVGDFLFQTSLIVKWKTKSFLGVLLHVFLVFIATLIVFIPYLQSSFIWMILIINAFTHIIIDQSKILYERGSKTKKSLTVFITDQILHLIVILFLVTFFPSTLEPQIYVTSWWFEHYEQLNLLIYIAGFLLFSYFFDIYFYIYKSGNKDIEYQRSYYSMLVRMFLFASMFISLWFIGRFYLHIF